MTEELKQHLGVVWHEIQDVKGNITNVQDQMTSVKKEILSEVQKENLKTRVRVKKLQQEIAKLLDGTRLPAIKQ